MLEIVEPRHVAAFLSPFEHGDVEASDFAEDVCRIGAFVLGAPMVASPELQAEFEIVRQRLLAEAI